MADKIGEQKYVVKRRWPVQVEHFQNCPRCGRQHKNLQFWRLLRSDPHYQLWSTCPRTTEPILALAKDMEENGEVEITIQYPPSQWELFSRKLGQGRKP